jgi:hypothetical protein|tara:strand:- start:1332 stop:1505 length:174 start_codon:yes stop_codon:yes gene_type:complete
MKKILLEVKPLKNEEENKIEKKRPKKLKEQDLTNLKDKNMLLAIFGKGYIEYLNRNR